MKTRWEKMLGYKQLRGFVVVWGDAGDRRPAIFPGRAVVEAM
jgi:hypothetical protein